MPAYTTETADISGRRQIVATVLFVVAALVTSYLPASTQQALAAALRSSVLRPFVTTQETLITTSARAAEADRLRKSLDSLVSMNTASGTLAEENRRLRALLALSEKLGPTFAAGTLVRAGTTGSEGTFLVDVGTAHGIHPDAPVISSQGLVGVIRTVQPDHSVGMDWTHPDFRAGAMSVDGATYGVVESRRGRFREEDRLVFNGTAFHTRLDDGTVIVTSGLGGVFPRGVPIGLIDGLAEAEGGWRKSYWLRPLVEPGIATHVLVAVGGDVAGPMDLTPVFPPDSVFTEEELAARERARTDSLSALGDSLFMFRQMVVTMAARDSARVAGASQARQDSLTRQALEDLSAADSARRRAALGGGQAPSGPAGAAQPRPQIRPPVARPAPRADSGGAAPTRDPAPPVQARPPAPDTRGPARIRPADTTSVRRMPVPTDTIRVGASARPDTLREGESR